MNSKNLIVAFVTVSIAALIVSAFAVFSVARTYSAALASAEAEETVSVPEITDAPSAETSRPAVTGALETEATDAEVTSSSPDMTEESGTDISETVSVPEITAENELFTLILTDSRLVITDASGGRLYERIIDASRLHPKDLEALLAGIAFPDQASAMSAVYDLIS